MKIVSVQVGRPRDVSHAGGTVRTGIFKAPVAGRVRVSATGLDGDGQADLSVHGGPDKAVYAYAHEHYDHWRRELAPDELAPGQFGENLTIEGALDDAVQVGDRFRAGTALLEVTQPRSPCAKLGIRMGRPGFPKTFLRSGRVGFYLRVLAEGELGAGDAFLRLSEGPGRLSIRELSRLRHFAPRDRDGARRALAVPALSADWRRAFEERLGPR